MRRLSDGAFHSGQDLAREFGLSRASVFNVLTQAEGLGLRVHAVRGRGYRLPDAIAWLTDAEIASGSQLVVEAGIDFVKTSTGQFEGPSLQQFLIMRDAVRGTPVRLKVAGVKFPRPQNALVFLRVGADRIGTRAAPEIVDSLPLLRQAGLLPG